jgi:hypothetical protein
MTSSVPGIISKLLNLDLMFPLPVQANEDASKPGWIYLGAVALNHVVYAPQKLPLHVASALLAVLALLPLAPNARRHHLHKTHLLARNSAHIYLSTIPSFQFGDNFY